MHTFTLILVAVSSNFVFLSVNQNWKIWRKGLCGLDFNYCHHIFFLIFWFFFFRIMAWKRMTFLKWHHSYGKWFAFRLFNSQKLMKVILCLHLKIKSLSTNWNSSSTIHVNRKMENFGFISCKSRNLSWKSFLSLEISLFYFLLDIFV